MTSPGKYIPNEWNPAFVISRGLANTPDLVALESDGSDHLFIGSSPAGYGAIRPDVFAASNNPPSSEANSSNTSIGTTTLPLTAGYYPSTVAYHQTVLVTPTEQLLEQFKVRKAVISVSLDTLQKSIIELRGELELVDTLLEAADRHVKACPSPYPPSS